VGLWVAPRKAVGDKALQGLLDRGAVGRGGGVALAGGGELRDGQGGGVGYEGV
jgi:hypothetical protein